ncbi:5'-methylthioadenosine/S-adenosylhomocysteine nucleosidase [Actinomyces sp. B33]|uniref:5'-methylthioadenosine/S-adenosylhomocysteine nucleosidase n=1 Tax=Actinomyces sp. B33 TaxID=2942131 RepID=UPI00234027A0|nr:5'-methylthioadenosine/S-adenosylhomocysteine nucleosidase [Actinomyces sp. B33]MDC4233909.1 5'-methylthioadenosine/S-adenosylhomocysteine nucleosidase [Actinomyces sp. B33]
MPHTHASPETIRVDAIIQCAMDMEARPLLDALTPPADGRATSASGLHDRHQQHFAHGDLDGHPVLVVTSGIGLANAAAATARALALVDAPIVIAAGTTGGLARDINVGDIAAGISTIYGAADATAFGYERGQIPRMPVDYAASETAIARLDALAERIDHDVRRGRVISSDFFATPPFADTMRADFPDAIATDMETCAMAQIAWSAGVDWISLRAVSDLAGPGADQAFHMDGERAAEHSARAVRAYLDLC